MALADLLPLKTLSLPDNRNPHRRSPPSLSLHPEETHLLNRSLLKAELVHLLLPRSLCLSLRAHLNSRLRSLLRRHLRSHRSSPLSRSRPLEGTRPSRPHKSLPRRLRKNLPRLLNSHLRNLLRRLRIRQSLLRRLRISQSLPHRLRIRQSLLRRLRISRRHP